MVRITILICLVFFSGWGSLSQESIRLKTVVIDAGHGGKDPGAVDKLVKEKDVVLNVALKFGNLIKENYPEVKVVYTRHSDVFVPLDKRAEIANKNNADLFISIHANYISTPKISGAETFVLGLHRSQDNLEVAKKENSVIVLEDDYTAKYEGFDPNSTESYIIFELMQNAFLDQSIEAASIIQTHFNTKAQRYNRGVKQAGFLVLRQTAMPGVLVELGFLSNPAEEKYLASANGQNTLANALFQAFGSYKHQFEAQNNITNGHVKESKVANITSEVKEKKPESVVYKIQVASSSTPFAKGKGILAKFPDAKYYKEKALYKYTVGETTSYQEALILQKKARLQAPDCFVVAFYQGNRITIKEARELDNQ